MIKSLLERLRLTPEERLRARVKRSLTKPILRSDWNHACPACGWPWLPAWHDSPGRDLRSIWSACGQCPVVAVDMMFCEAQTGRWVSFISFMATDDDLAREQRAEMARWPVHQIGLNELTGGLPGHRGNRRLADWDGRCPGCRARWRDSAWVDEAGEPAPIASCVCLAVGAHRYTGRDPVSYDLVDWIEFFVDDEPVGDDEFGRGDMMMIADGIHPRDWPGLCPACDAPMASPADADDFEEIEIPDSQCPDCGAVATLFEFHDEEPEIIVEVIIDRPALARL